MVQIGDVFTFMDDEENEQDIEVLGTMSVNGVEYAAAAFVEDVEDDAGEEVDVFFFKIENDQLIIVDEDDEFEQVSAAFEAASLEEE